MCGTSDCCEHSFETKAIHSGQLYDLWSNRELVPPIVTSTTYFQPDPTSVEVCVIFINIFFPVS